MKLVLASKSPYRKKLLSRLGYPFEVSPSNINENLLKQSNLTNLEIAYALAKEKAKVVLNSFPDSMIIGSDQILVFQNQIFDKPGNHQKALEQLNLLNAKTHHLITAVSVISRDNEYHFHNKTELTMKELSEDEISCYLLKDTPYDCVGSYKIESFGIGLFENIKTDDFSAIEGLPLIALSAYLRSTLGPWLL